MQEANAIEQVKVLITEWKRSNRINKDDEKIRKRWEGRRRKGKWRCERENKRERRSIDFSFRSNIERARPPFLLSKTKYSIDLTSYGISCRVKWSTCIEKTWCSCTDRDNLGIFNLITEVQMKLVELQESSFVIFREKDMFSNHSTKEMFIFAVNKKFMIRNTKHSAKKISERLGKIYILLCFFSIFIFLRSSISPKNVNQIPPTLQRKLRS